MKNGLKLSVLMMRFLYLQDRHIKIVRHRMIILDRNPFLKEDSDYFCYRKIGIQMLTATGIESL